MYYLPMAEMMWRERPSLRESRVSLSVVDSPHTLTRLSMVWSARLVVATAAPVTEHPAAVLVSVPVGPLDEEGLLLRVRLADRVVARAQALAHIALADHAGSYAVDGDRQRHLRLEATRVGGALTRALATIDPKVQAKRARVARSRDFPRTRLAASQ